MRKAFIFITFIILSSSAFAAKDSLFVVSNNDKWMIQHKIKAGEQIFDVAKRYHVPPAMLADENGINFQATLSQDDILYVPLGAFNKTNTEEGRNVYYRVREGDNLYRISKNANEPQRVLQEWNELPDNNVEQGQTIVVAKILYDKTAMPAAQQNTFAKKTDTAKKQQKGVTDSLAKGQKYTVNKVARQVMENGKPVTYLVNDTVWVDTLGVYGQMYMKQTLNEKKIVEEKGTAVFYTLVNKVQNRYQPQVGSNNQHFIYAFHNEAKRGTIIRVYNPGTDKFIYVKVMGGLPETKQYYNSIIGISSDAREALGVNDEKTWVELKYAP